MSGLSQLLASARARIWIRLRLLRSRRPAVVGHSDLYLPQDEIPVEGADYPTVAIPSEVVANLDSLRMELTDHATGVAHRRSRRRHLARRRTLALTSATLALLAVLGAGASALISGTTGVAEVDRLLGLQQSARQQSEDDVPVGHRGGRVNPQPTVDGNSVSVELSDGTKRFLNTSYVSEDGQVCSVLAEASTSSVTCRSAEAITDLVSADLALILGFSSDSATTVRGFVSGRARSVEIEGPGGPLDVAISEPWSPTENDSEALRAFIAVGPRQGTAPLSPEELRRQVEVTNYRFRIELDDGKVVESSPSPPA